MANKNNPKEVFLVLRSQSGDKQAFDELLKTVQVPLFRYIYRLIGEHALAEDILQEVFIIIYRKLTWLDNPKLFRAWAYRITSRAAFKHLKKEMRWSEQIRDEKVLEMLPAKPVKETYAAELTSEIPKLISEVSPASRAVLILHYLDEMPLSEVAEILDVSLGTVKSRLAYGLASLREKIKKEQ